VILCWISFSAHLPAGTPRVNIVTPKISVGITLVRIASNSAPGYPEAPVTFAKPGNRDLDISVAHQSFKFLAPLDQQDRIVRKEIIQT
jgi:hypothetical protein